jgi:hypothetical protein
MSDSVFNAVHIPSGRLMKVFLTHQESVGQINGECIITAYLANSKDKSPQYVKFKDLKIKK